MHRQQKPVLLSLLGIFLILGLYSVWNAWPKRKELSGNTFGEVLELSGCLTRIEPFLDKVGVAKDTPLSEPPKQMTRLGVDLVQSVNYYVIGLTFSKDGVIHRAVHMPADIKNVPERPDGLLKEEEFQKQMEELIALDVWGDTGEISYEIKVHPSPDLGREYEPTTYYGTAQRSYKGFLCASGVDFYVDRSKGVITDMANLPFKKPKSLEEKVSEQEAVGIATAFAKKKGIVSEDYDVQQLITPTNSFWSMAKAALVTFSPDTRLCWVVVFKAHNRDVATVLVSCDTGRIVGGDWHRMDQPPGLTLEDKSTIPDPPVFEGNGQSGM